MEFNEYQNIARETAIYPGKGGVGEGDLTGLTYTILGLIGEAAEMKENNTTSEQGDNAWYFSQITYELEIPLSFIVHRKKKGEFGSYIGAIGQLANVYKKVFRDDGGVLTQKRRDKIVDILVDAFHLFLLQVDDIEEVFESNVDKLSGRKSSGKIKGEGDNR